MSGAPPKAILAFSALIDRLDYYEVLGLSPSANTAAVREAYYRRARLFHPDANREISEVLESRCRRIAQRLNESYCILRNPGLRQAYDRERNEYQRLRIPLAKAQRESVRRSREAHTGRTARGRPYAERAQACARSQDWPGAVRNFLTALTFEPDNETLRSDLADARRHLD